MVQRVTYTLYDDIDGAPADETVRFGLDGVSYEIDLSAANAAQLREALALYIGSGRRAAGSRRGRPAAAAGTKKASATDVRAWAAANGHQVSARGRVPAAVRAAYEAAHA